MEKQILEQIEAQAALRGISPKTLCRFAVNNGKLHSRLQNGGSVTLQTVAKLNAFFMSPIYVQVKS